MRTEFVEDRKLDNNRVKTRISLVRFDYMLGDTEIKREIIKYKARSGWSSAPKQNSFCEHCLDPVGKGHSVSFREIGQLQNGWGNGIFIYAYRHKEEEALEKVRKSLKKAKRELLFLAESIPV